MEEAGRRKRGWQWSSPWRMTCAHSKETANGGYKISLSKNVDRQPKGCILEDRGMMARSPMDDDEAVFGALANASRRQLLDQLYLRDGLTLSELCKGLQMTRQAVTKHLAVLEAANLVAWKRSGREKLHYINPVPINAIAERWIEKFEKPHLKALSRLKRELEDDTQ